MVNNLKRSFNYQLARNYVFKTGAGKVVGYSLGGAIAERLAGNIPQIKHARICSSPSVTCKDGHKTKHVFIIYLILYRVLYIIKLLMVHVHKGVQTMVIR